MQRLAARPVPDSFAKTASICAPSDSDTVPAETITWRVNLLRENPGKLVGVAAGAFFVMAAAFALFRLVLPGLVAALLLLVSVAEYLLPLTYTFDSNGVHVSCGPVEWLSMDWKAVRSAYRTSYGIKLSPFVDPKTARMENCRGIRLRVPLARLAEIEAGVARHLEDTAK
jgi:hypothetical protein